MVTVTHHPKGYHSGETLSAWNVRVPPPLGHVDMALVPVHVLRRQADVRVDADTKRSKGGPRDFDPIEQLNSECDARAAISS